MAKSTISWDQDRLTLSEKETLQELIDKGAEIYAAPIEIEHKGQLETLGITYSECRTWHIGSERFIVHLTPADKATYDYQLGELRKKHRDAYRKHRCKIPGTLKPLIPCPECNSCANCPFPEYRDQHQPDNISWDGLIDSGYEEVSNTDEIRLANIRVMLESVSAEISAVNPKFTAAITLKEFYGFTVPEIADMMEDSERNVYYYIAQAKEIGKKLKKKYQ